MGEGLEINLRIYPVRLAIVRKTVGIWFFLWVSLGSKYGEKSGEIG